MSATFRKRIAILCLGSALLIPVHAKAATPSTDLVTADVLASIRSFIDQDIVRLSVINQNVKYKDFNSDDIERLDKQWVEETKTDSKPLISATLSNPLSAYLTRIQAHSSGLYTEIFVMDKNGLNVGQSNISSDYWQGDEAKFQKTYPLGGDAVFIDEPEYNDETGTWNAQVNVSISDGTDPAAIGAVTIEVNLTELQRRAAIAKPGSLAEPVADSTPQILEPAAPVAPDTPEDNNARSGTADMPEPEDVPVPTSDEETGMPDGSETLAQ